MARNYCVLVLYVHLITDTYLLKGEANNMHGACHSVRITRGTLGLSLDTPLIRKSNEQSEPENGNSGDVCKIKE